MKLYNKQELRDSRVFFEKNPPKFLTIFVIFVFILIVSSITVSTILVKSYVVLSQGIITTTDNQYVAIQSDGSIIEIISKEGQKVEKGDILFKLTTGQDNIQSNVIIEQINELNNKVDIMDKFENSILTGINYMNNSGDEQEYYGKVDYYLQLIKGEKFDLDNVNAEYNERVNKKELLLIEMNQFQTELDNLEVNDENSENRASIIGKIDEKKAEITTVEAEIKQSLIQINAPSSQANQIKSQMISELGNARVTNENQRLELEGQLAMITAQEGLLTIRAKNDGYVHYLSPIKVGMGVQKGQTIAEISQNENNQFIVESYIEAKDISKVKVGDHVNVALQGVNISKYGTLDGRLIFIDSGTITQESASGNIILYKCQIALVQTELVAKDSNVINVVKSMPVEARIIYQKETYFEWFLEQLNFKS